MVKFYYLDQLMIAKHSGFKPILCSICGKFKRRSKFGVEMSENYTTTKKCICIQCETNIRRLKIKGVK